MKKILITTVIMVAALGVWAQGGSALASGQWWKLRVEEEGMYRLTTSHVPGLNGAAIENVAVYGGGGRMLSTANSETPIADLQQVATQVIDANGNGLFDSGDELLFFGESAEGWHYDETAERWVFEHHAYATANYYYVTTGCPAPMRIATAAAVEGGVSITRHTVVGHVDNDLVNPYETGQLWMGEKLTTAMAQRTMSVRLPGSNIGDVKIRWAVASKDCQMGRFILNSGSFQQSENTSMLNPYHVVTGVMTESSEQYTFTLAFASTESAGSGYLDYIELNATAAIVFGGGQMMVRNDSHMGEAVAFGATGMQGARVWEVTTAGGEREMAVADGVWTDSAQQAKQYVIFDNYSFLQPAAVTPLSNQDLHGAEAADLVIVTHPSFRLQAERLAGLHEVFDGLDVLTVTDEEVYNEFSSGKQDPMAIRALLRWLTQRHPSQSPRYLLLFGKGTYDNRHLLGSTLPTVVTYESPYSFDDDGMSYASDDMMGYTGPQSRGASTETLQVSSGRLPAKDSAEATLLVDKIEGYITRRDLADDANRGDWRNYVALLSDDADPGKPGDSLFAHSSEVVAKAIMASMPELNVERYYADAYHQESGAIGSYYPDLNNALRQRIDYGCLLLNYIGHGSMAYIGTERYIEPSDLGNYSNTDRLPLLVTSTCSYGHYDQPETECGAETAVLAPAAMVAVISASRPISHVERFNKDVVLFALDPANTIGDALRLAKNRTPSPLCISLIGDPALHLSRPDNRVRVTHINQEPVCDTEDVRAEVLSRVTVSGEIQDTAGLTVTDFDGMIYPVVYDREVHTRTLANDNPGTEVQFSQQKNILYKGAHRVTGGRFEYSFIVPKDVAYRYDYAKLSHYAKSGADHASGSYSRLMLGGMCDSSYDGATPPEVTLFIGDSNFRSGGLTGTSPMLVALLRDSAGINVGSGLGHDITAILDDNPNNIVVLNDLYEQDITDSRCGSATYTYRDLAPGHHKVTVKAWNIFGLSATAEVDFCVRGADSLVFSQLVCFPNPASEVAQLQLRVNRPNAIASAQIELYNTMGQRMAQFTPPISEGGYMVGPVRWNVATVPPGVYLARMVLTDTDGETYHISTKCVVR